MKHVLIVDDHEVTRRGLRELVRETLDAPEVGEAGTHDELLAMLGTAPWDLVLLDALLPGGGLVENIGAIRSVLPDVPLLVVTGATEPEFVLQSLQAGANGLVHKHRAVEELMSAIERVVGGDVYLDAESASLMAGALRDESSEVHEALSERELDVFLRIARGQTLKEIGADLFISSKTVSTYVGRIRQKTGLITYVDMARYCLQRGLVD